MAVRLEDVFLLCCSTQPLTANTSEKDSTRTVILQLGAIQLSSAAMRSFMIDVHNPSK